MGNVSQDRQVLLYCLLCFGFKKAVLKYDSQIVLQGHGVALVTRLGCLECQNLGVLTLPRLGFQ